MLSIMTHNILIFYVFVVFFESGFNVSDKISDNLRNKLIRNILDCCICLKDCHDAFLRNGVVIKRSFFSDVQDGVELFENIDVH